MASGALGPPSDGTIDADANSVYESVRREIVKWARNGRGQAISLEDEPVGEQEGAPTSWGDFVDRLSNLETSAFIVTDNARKSASETGLSGHRSHVAAHQAQGADEYSENERKLGVRLEHWISERFGLDVALKESSISKIADFEWDGRLYNREPHVKVDDAKAPNECGRIYFAYHSADGQPRFIVDHIGTHL